MNREEIKKAALKLHKQHAGKLRVEAKGKVKSLGDLSLYYTPGVGDVSSLLHKKPELTREYTGTNNSVAIVSDGSAVLGLGNIGPKAALPVMEGKALLFNQFAQIDGYPVVLDVHTADEIVSAVKAIAPSYGAINLEDISAPICFEVEEKLKAELDIPVMHDDQHGTAVVVLAGLINALKVTGKNSLASCKIVVVGSGAAGVAITKLLIEYNSKCEVLVVDSKGILNVDRDDLNQHKAHLADITNKKHKKGGLKEAVKGADIFIGVSQANLLTPELVKTMAKDPIIFALANPDPEIVPDLAHKAGATVVATGRSDYPNQINNALAFPGIFRGALDNGVSKITDKHKLAAAKIIASLVASPTAKKIIPDIFDKRLVPEISKVIK